jgi:hypothetical protein
MTRYVALILLFLLTCGQLKVSTLRPEKVCTIPNDSGLGGVAVKFADNGLADLSFSVKVYNGRIYTADNILKRIQVLEMDSTPELVIGQKGSKTQGKKVIQSAFNFSVIGAIAVDNDRNIYVQNRFVSSRDERTQSGDELNFSPSYVLIFDRKGSLQHTLGQSGLPDIPFDYIDNLDVDKKDRLFIITRKFDSWSVFRFSSRKKDFQANFTRNDFREKDGDLTYEGKIENISVLNGGEDFLVCAAYYHDLRFKFRKIYSYSIKERKIARTVVSIPDPKNELYSVINDKHIYLWNIDDKKTRFVICNFDGNIINNIQLKQDGKKNFFSEVLIDESGQFFSYSVNKDSIEIMEWK